MKQILLSIYALSDVISQEHFLIVIFLILFTIVSIVLTCLMIKSRKKNIKFSLKNESFGRVYRIDLNKEKVTCVDLISSERQNQFSFSDFLKIFHKSDREPVEKFLNDVLNKDYEGKNYFEYFVYDRIFHDDIFVLFKVKQVIYEEKVIYLDFYRFSNLTNTKVFRYKKNMGLFLDEKSLYKYEAGKNKKGLVIYNIHLFSKQEFYPKDNGQEHLIMLHIVQSLMATLHKNHFLCMYDETELFAFDFKPNDEKEIQENAEILKEKIDTSLSLQSLNSLYDYRLGVYYEQGYDSASLKEKMKLARDTAIYAMHSSEENKVIYYDKKIDFKKTKQNQKIEEMNHILKENCFNVLYAPYVDAKTGRTKGFLCDITVNSKIIPSLSELEMLVHQQNRMDDFVELILENALHGLEDPSLKKKMQRFLIIPMPLFFFPNVKKYIETHPLKDVHLSFMLDQDDFLYLGNMQNSVKKVIQGISEIGCLPSIKLDNTKVELNKEILELFSCYILDDDFVYNNVTNMRGKILIDKLLNQLELYKSPIIATGISIWSHAELLASLGVEFLSGSAIALPSETINDVSRKVTLKITQMNS